MSNHLTSCPAASAAPACGGDVRTPASPSTATTCSSVAALADAAGDWRSAGDAEADPVWRDPRPHWSLDPSVTFLNNGSFGAVPNEVIAFQDALRREMEREPVDFLVRQLPGRIAAARERAAAFLGADPRHLVFVPNATTAVNVVLASMDFPPGSVLLTTDHVYPAVINTMQALSERRGWQVRIVHLPLPTQTGPAAVHSMCDAILDQADGEVRMVVLDQVASPTGLILPVEPVVAACRERGILALVDGAHAPGMIPLRLDFASPSTPDFWTGNFHKWVYTPRGAAALIYRPEFRSRLRPAVISNFHGRGPDDEFMWTGTHDPTPYLSVPAGIDFLEARGAARVREHNNRLVRLGQRLVQEVLGTPLPIADSTDFYASLGLVEIPAEYAVADPSKSQGVMDGLFARHRVEVPFTCWNGRTFVRLSAQLFNRPEDYARLADVLPGFLKEARHRWQSS